MNGLPNKYIENLSHAQTNASASFSVCEYLFSTSDNALLAKLIGLKIPYSSCARTAPNPTGLASAITVVSAHLSKMASVSALLIVGVLTFETLQLVLSPTQICRWPWCTVSVALPLLPDLV